MKKGVQIAFAITLLIISVLATFNQSKLFDDIIYAVVIPSFLLSVISFAAEIREKCGKNAHEFEKVYMEHSDLKYQSAQQKLTQYDQGTYHQPYKEGFVPKDIYEEITDSLNQINKATVYINIRLFLSRCEKALDIINITCYVLLFLSLIFSPYIVSFLSSINLNCMTLWSLTLLYFSVELKSQVCAKVFDGLVKFYEARGKDIPSDDEESS